MSNEIFPVLPGLKWDISKKPMWSNSIKTSVSGKERRATYWTYPRWEFKMSYELLRNADAVTDATTELKRLMGFFLARKGSFDNFLFRDPSDCSVVQQLIGTGNGSNTDFQLVRSMDQFSEPIKNIDSSDAEPIIYLDEMPQTSGYTISSTGLVSFDNAVASDVKITADFSFYFRVRFLQDEKEFNQFMYQLFELKSLELISVKGEE